jgi:hypothetical protein
MRSGATSSIVDANSARVPLQRFGCPSATGALEGALRHTKERVQELGCAFLLISPLQAVLRRLEATNLEEILGMADAGTDEYRAHSTL